MKFCFIETNSSKTMRADSHSSQKSNGIFLRFFEKMTSSKLLVWKISRFVLLGSLTALALKTLWQAVIESLVGDVVYRKDFLQDYLLALAVRQGVNPYLPISQLQKLLLNESQATVFWHPTPHPPTIALLFQPFALVSYLSAATAWVYLEIFFVICLSIVLQKLQNLSITLNRTLLICIFLFASCSFRYDLIQGQFSILLALFFGMFVLRMQHKQEYSAGLWLGLASCLKYAGLPIFLLLLLKRSWRSLGSALAVFGLLHTLSLFLLGNQSFFGYFRNVATNVFQLYRTDEYCQSLWSIAPKLFIGIKPIVQYGISAPPLFDNAKLVQPVGLILSVLFLLVVLRKAFQSDSVRSAFAATITASVILSPIAWVHSYAISVIGISAILLQLGTGSARQASLGWGILFVTLWFVGDFFRILSFGESDQSTFLKSLITYIPLATNIGLTFLSLHSSAYPLHPSNHEPQ